MLATGYTRKLKLSIYNLDMSQWLIEGTNKQEHMLAPLSPESGQNMVAVAQWAWS
jgi:hypothetical protein